MNTEVEWAEGSTSRGGSRIFKRGGVPFQIHVMGGGGVENRWTHAKKTRSRHIVVHLHKCSFNNSLHTDHNVIASFKKPMGGSVEPTEPPTDQYTGSPGRGGN